MIAFAEDLERLKRQILELLEKDREFRHAIVGMLKLERVLKGLRRQDRRFEKLLESLNRHEAELVKLRLGSPPMGEARASSMEEACV